MQAIALLLAQRQQQQQEAEQAQSPERDIMQQLAPLLAGRGRGPRSLGGVVPEISGDDPTPRYGVRPQAQRATYARSGGSNRDPFAESQRAANASDLQNQRFAQQAQRDQFQADQDAQQLAARQQQQDEELAVRDADMMTRQQSEDLPQWIQKELGQTIRYSQLNRRERQNLADANDKVQARKDWSPADKARFQASNREKIRQLDLSTEPIPVNERPVTPQQQAAQNTWMEPDPVTGQNVEWQNETRSGATKKVPTATGQATIDNWVKEQEHRRNLESIAAKNAAKPDTQAINQQKEDAKTHNDYVNSHRQRELELVGPRPKPTEYKTQDANGAVIPDDAAFQKADNDWLAAVQEVNKRYPVDEQYAAYLSRQQAQFQDLGAALGGMSVLPIPGGPTMTGGSSSFPGDSAPQAPMEDLAGGMGGGPPDSTLHPHPAVGPEQWISVPIGGITTLPNGMKVRKTGPSSYEPVQ